MRKGLVIQKNCHSERSEGSRRMNRDASCLSMTMVLVTAYCHSEERGILKKERVRDASYLSMTMGLSFGAIVIQNGNVIQNETVIQSEAKNLKNELKNQTVEIYN